MNREIKFRGYSEELKSFVYGFYQEVEAEGVGYSYIFLQGNTTPVRADSVAQFTGLIDKNGIEIFEGDIVKADWHWEDGKIVDLSYQGLFFYAISEYALEDVLEVIGNIFENYD